MNPDVMAPLLGHPVARALGWSLLQFIWQGALIGVSTFVAFALLRDARGQTRYLVGCAALVLMMLVPVATTLATLQSFNTSRTAPGGAALATALARVGPSVLPAIESIPDPPRRPEAAFAAALPSGAVSAWIPSILAAWLAGVLLLTLRLVAGWTLLHRRLQREHMPAGRVWQDRLSRLAMRMGVTRVVRLIESVSADVPCSVGWWRPVVLVPVSALAGLTPEQLEAILAHELAHIRRHDYIVNLLQTVVETLLFYHPAVWWVSRRVRVEREYCCDDWAVAVCGDTVGYARALTELEHLRQPCASLVLAAAGGSLVARVK